MAIREGLPRIQVGFFASPMHACLPCSHNPTLPLWSKSLTSTCSYAHAYCLTPACWHKQTPELPNQQELLDFVILRYWPLLIYPRLLRHSMVFTLTHMPSALLCRSCVVCVQVHGIICELSMPLQARADMNATSSAAEPNAILYDTT